jgi:hypothetical protein
MGSGDAEGSDEAVGSSKATTAGSVEMIRSVEAPTVESVEAIAATDSGVLTACTA